MGKSTLAKTLAAGFSNTHLTFVFDFIGEYSGEVFTDRRGLVLAPGRAYLYRGNNDHYFADTVFQAGKTGVPILCVLDEVDIFGKNSVPLAWLYRYGRHRNISLLAIARRFKDLPTYIRALSSEFKVFRVTEEIDLKYIAAVQNKDTAALVRSLPPHKFITIKL